MNDGFLSVLKSEDSAINSPVSFDSCATCLLTSMVDAEVVLRRWAMAIGVSRADKHRTYEKKTLEFIRAIMTMFLQYLRAYRDVAMQQCR